MVLFVLGLVELEFGNVWFVKGLIRGWLKRETSFFISFCNNKQVAPLFFARFTVSLGRDLEV